MAQNHVSTRSACVSEGFALVQEIAQPLNNPAPSAQQDAAAGSHDDIDEDDESDEDNDPGSKDDNVEEPVQVVRSWLCEPSRTMKTRRTVPRSRACT